MQFDSLTLFQLFLISTFLFSIIYYVKYSINSNRKALYNNYSSLVIKVLSKRALNFSTLIKKEDYISYEKLQVWRFTVHF
ncbi:hypothetical protein SAMN02745163_03458 [Clostridium cavendishii DSM 21758]|uniref:Uncharacterized protein n=1 Tax=Clostridium cavendishii DSM 21758 TaxID=1121302 RepID=A0A1M6QUA4_9CLOT|nr:hypothetical protein SAMN02745163_03458 [Clostridium cavendishii DSM 21758]